MGRNRSQEKCCGKAVGQCWSEDWAGIRFKSEGGIRVRVASSIRVQGDENMGSVLG